MCITLSPTVVVKSVTLLTILVLFVALSTTSYLHQTLEAAAHQNSIKSLVLTSKKTQHFTITKIKCLTLFEDLIPV